jgi:hypothetical protein
MKRSEIKVFISRKQARRHEQYRRIPPAVLDAIYRFVEDGLMPGDLVCAVMANDLAGAITHADSHVDCLDALVAFVHNRIPTICYKINGVPSRKAMQRWARWCAQNRENIDPDET